METCRLSASHLRLGVPLPGNVYDDAGKMLLAKGQVLDSQERLEELLARGMYVDIATFDAHYRPSSSAPAPAADNRFDPFLQRQGLKTRLHRLLRCVLEGSATVGELVALADELVRLADTDPDAAVAATLLDRDEASYPTAHSLGCATLCALAAQRLGWDDARRRSLIGAALTMNVGMLEFHQRLQRQTTPLTPAQQEQLRAHPRAAVGALTQIGIDDPAWLKAVAEHHERPDGAGYPAALTEPGEAAGLIRLADIFAARIMPRADRRAMAPAVVVKALFVDEGRGPAGPLVGALFKLLELYPPGSFVRLANGEIGVVFRRGGVANAPVVASVTTSSGSPLMQPVRRETERKEFAVAGTLLADKVPLGYDLAKLWIAPRRH